ncbi:MAG: hypothetical protein JXK08_09950, partial [Flavobacteriaceae bacterium]|nr:hypothetical protein [Flavobacteriaceae bacterium]
MKKIIIALSLIIVLIAGTLFTSYTLVNDGQNLSATGFGEYVVEIVQPAQEDPTIALNEQIDALELDLFNNTQTIASLNAEVAVLLSEAEDYELQIELLNTNIATIQNQKEALEAEVATLEADALANADRIATLNAIITAKNVEIADLTSQVNALTASLADVNAQLTTANATITALTTEIADLNAYINLLEEKTTSSLSVLGQDLGTWNSVYYDTVDLGD